MSLTFYTNPMSTAGITELVVAELGLSPERVVLDVQNGETRTPAFLAVNPNGKVPTIVHDGTAIFESAAITIHLGETFGVDKGLWPGPGPRRGQAMSWVVWTNVTAASAVARWMGNTSKHVPAEMQNAKAGERARKDVDDCLRVLDGVLADKEFVTGTFTLADAHLYAFVGWIQTLGVDLAPFTNVVAWTKRCAARPAFQKLMGR